MSLPNPETKNQPEEAQSSTPPTESASRTQDTPASDSSSLDTTSIDKTEPTYVPNVYQPDVPKAIDRVKWTRSSVARYGVPSYTSPYSYQMTISGLQCNYKDIHSLFEESLDPYSDCFFFFSPGFGFPSPVSTSETGEPLLQIASPSEWGPVLPMLLATKCPIFVTGFSPADVERDIKSLSTAPGVAGEFEWIITPGPNSFGSEKWEVADFDPRVMVKTNWGIWGIRGKSRDIQEQGFFSKLLSRS